MRFFKHSTFPWAIVCAVGIEREGWEEACPKSQGPDLECHTQIDMHKQKGGGELKTFSVQKRYLMCLKTSVCTSFNYWLFTFVYYTQNASQFWNWKYENWFFHQASNSLWILVGSSLIHSVLMLSNQEILQSSVLWDPCSEAVPYQAGTRVSDQLPTNHLSTIPHTPGLINLLVSHRSQENIFFLFFLPILFFPFFTFLIFLKRK